MYGLLGVVVLIAVVVFYSRKRGGGAIAAPPKPACTWTKTGEAKGKLQEYRCETCAVVGYSSTGNPPIECKRNLKTGS